MRRYGRSIISIAREDALFWRISAAGFFALHRRLTPAIRLYRHFNPLPRSPEPLNDADRFTLKLVPSDRLTQKFEQAIRFLRRHSENPVETYIEFGVYNGTSMSCMHRAFTNAGVRNPRLIGFDSFQGLPPGSDHEDGGVWRVGQFTCPVDVTLRNLNDLGVPLEKVQLVEGWFADTLAGPAKHPIHRNVSIVMIDSDTYSSAKLALQYVEPILADLSVIFFDDWKLNDLDIRNMGEFRAFREFVDEHPNLEVRLAPGYNRKSMAAVIRRRSTRKARA